MKSDEFNYNSDMYIYNENYLKESKFIKKNFIIYILIFIFILCLLFSFIFGLFYLRHYSKYNDGNVVTYNLIVSHSNGQYGGYIKSFEKNNEKSSAFSYVFYVNNSNSLDINYFVNLYIIDSDVDLSMVNYQLIKNRTIIASSGTLGDISDNKLYSANIKSDKTDYYTLKIWSSIKGNVNMKYKIDVLV